MQNESKNKMVGGTTKAPELQDYFFSGGTEYKPVTVRASSQADAQTEWEKVREPVGAEKPAQNTPTKDTHTEQ